MNIFVLDTDTKKCAEYHVDKHAVKMVKRKIYLGIVLSVLKVKELAKKHY